MHSYINKNLKIIKLDKIIILKEIDHLILQSTE